VAAPSTPVSPHLRRVAAAAATVALFAVGIIIDAMGIINVPGAAELPAGEGGDARLGGVGAGLFLLAIAAWITVFWRRRVPVLTLIAGCVLAAIGLSYVLLLVGAVATVLRRPAWTVRVAIGVSVGAALFALREVLTGWGGALAWTFTQRAGAQHEPAWIAASFVWVVISLGVAGGVVFIVRARERVARSDVRAAQEQQRADMLNEQMVRQNERERIARDMHDQLTSRLSVVSLHAGALESASGDGEAAEMARTVREQTRAALQDLRGLLGDLRSGPGAASSSPATMRALGQLLGEHRAAGAPITAYVVLEDPERASTQFDGAVYRIVQEALTNARKHAPGVAVDVHVQAGPVEGARIRIVNPLAAAGAAVPGGGNGTVGIRERAAALGGTAWIGDHEGCFIVDVTLPWQERG
jgi:signal transduction histidine kinase